MWIARDKNTLLHLFTTKPKLEGYIFVGEDEFDNDTCIYELSRYLFPEVTFENSPKELVIKGN